MDKTLRNTFIGILATVIIGCITGWVQINSRIAVLEVQVNNDRELMLRNDQNIKEIKTMLQQIQIGVQHLNDVKADKLHD